MGTFTQSETELLAIKAKAVSEASPAPRSQPVVPRTGSGPWLLSFGQERIWFLHQFACGSPVYSVPIAMRIDGRLDLRALNAALSALMARHETLRTLCVSIDGTPAQAVAPPTAVDLPCFDIEALPEEQKPAQLEKLIQDLIRKPFDLERDLPLKAYLIRTGEQNHTLVLNLHHISADGWSMGILNQELVALYQGFSHGAACELTPLPVQYPDFAEWQRQRFTREALAKQLSYWRKQLEGAPPYLELPTDHPRPAIQTYNGARHFFQMPAALAAGLREFSARQGVSLFMTLLAGFEVLLHRYTSQEDIVVGTPIANRPRPEIEGLIGFFLNNLALRVDLSGDPSFGELLARVRRVALEAYGHYELPFEMLLEELKPERDLTRSPIFQVMFTLQSSPTATTHLRDLSLSSRELDTRTSKFELFVVMQERGPELGGYVEYNTDLFELSTIQRMLSHFERVLQAALRTSDEKISRLPLMGEEERRQLVDGWNNTQAAYPQHCIHQLFEAQAERTPSQIVLTFGSQQLSCRELNRRANQLARKLKDLGVGPQVLVGVCLDRSFNMVVALLAILKAGGAYVPLDPAYPANWLSFILEDAETQVVLTQQKLLERLPDRHGVKLICLDRDWPEIARQESTNLGGDSSIDDLAYVIYTSGSTGTPKGVLAPHRGAVNRFAWMWRQYPFAAEEVCCQKTSLNFVDSVWEIFGPLLQGVRSVLIKDETVRNPLELIQLLARERVSRIVVVPSLLRFLLEAYSEQPEGSHQPKLWISSGETLPADLCRKFHEVMPQSILLNLYGSSEVAADVTWHQADGADQDSSAASIGLPIANTQVHILDSRLQLVPVGITGEIYVGGDGLAHGYHKRPDLTAERFLPNPSSEFSGKYIYRTGDLAFRRTDGQIQYLGRSDGQVKIRGFRIEPGEIEATLKSHAGVRQSVVSVQESEHDGKHLVAYVVPAETILAEEELRAFLQQNLPDYMVPAAFMFLPALPMTPNGKVDHRALPKAQGRAETADGEKVSPRDELEAKLAGIWQTVLGQPSVGVTENFFDLGGHSLLVGRLLLRIDKAFGRKLSLADVFRAPTVERLALVLRSESAPSEPAGILEVKPVGTRPALFWVRGGPLFRSMALRLGPDQPFLGLDLPPSLMTQLSVPYRFEEIAAAFVKVMREAQPHGPYFLGGFCVNGVVAYEMARQLVEAGEPVPLLALFDTQNPVTYSDYSQDGRVGYLRGKGRFHLAKLKEVKFGQVHSYLGDLMVGARRRMRRWIWYLSYAGRRAFRWAGMENLDAIIHLASERYRPRPYAGRIVLFQSTVWPEGKYWDFEIGWRELATGGVEMHRITGDHLGMFEEPNVSTVAGKLNAHLSTPTAVAA